MGAVRGRRSLLSSLLLLIPLRLLLLPLGSRFRSRSRSLPPPHTVPSPAPGAELIVVSVSSFNNRATTDEASGADAESDSSRILGHGPLQRRVAKNADFCCICRQRQRKRAGGTHKRKSDDHKGIIWVSCLTSKRRKEKLRHKKFP